MEVFKEAKGYLFPKEQLVYRFVTEENIFICDLYLLDKNNEKMALKTGTGKNKNVALKDSCKQYIDWVHRDEYE